MLYVYLYIISICFLLKHSYFFPDLIAHWDVRKMAIASIGRLYVPPEPENLCHLGSLHWLLGLMQCTSAKWLCEKIRLWIWLLSFLRMLYWEELHGVKITSKLFKLSPRGTNKRSLNLSRCNLVTECEVGTARANYAADLPWTLPFVKGAPGAIVFLLLLFLMTCFSKMSCNKSLLLKK